MQCRWPSTFTFSVGSLFCSSLSEIFVLSQSIASSPSIFTYHPLSKKVHDKWNLVFHWLVHCSISLWTHFIQLLLQEITLPTTKHWNQAAHLLPITFFINIECPCLQCNDSPGHHWLDCTPDYQQMKPSLPSQCPYWWGSCASGESCSGDALFAPHFSTSPAAGFLSGRICTTQKMPQAELTCLWETSLVLPADKASDGSSGYPALINQQLWETERISPLGSRRQAAKMRNSQDESK